LEEIPDIFPASHQAEQSFIGIIDADQVNSFIEKFSPQKTRAFLMLVYPK
jgi:hypothetical protein